MIDLGQVIKIAEKQSDDKKCIVTLQKNEHYFIKKTIYICRNMQIEGNGAVIQNETDLGLLIASSDVKISNLKICGGGISIRIDNRGKTIKNIVVQNCEMKDYAFSGLVIGASEGNGMTQNILVKDCVIWTEPLKKEDGTDCVVALDVLLTAGFSDKKNLENTLLKDVVIDHCSIKGHSICNIMSVPGLSANPDSTPVFKNCRIEDISVTNSKLIGSDDTVIAAQANYINNESCYCQNFIVCNNEIEFGLTGLSASAGSPMTGKVEKIFFREIKFINNKMHGRKNVGETRTAIGIGAGGINYKPTSCNKSGIENVEIKGNTIIECERGITVSAGYSMIDADAPSELRENYVRNIIIKSNYLKDVQNCFMFYAAWIEGRRFDWNWGVHHTTQTWLPPVENHQNKTVVAKGNYIENLICEENSCDGFSYLLCAAAVMARGHGLVTENKIKKNFVFRKNKHCNGEEHVAIRDVILEDWVTDGGNNTLEQSNIQI